MRGRIQLVSALAIAVAVLLLPSLSRAGVSPAGTGATGPSSGGGVRARTLPKGIVNPAPSPPPSPSPSATTAAVASPTGSGTSGPRHCAAVGLFVPGESPAEVTALASTLGVRATIQTVYADQPSYTTVSWLPDTTSTLLLAVGAVTPAQATTIGRYLVADHHSDTIVRIMWEMNGDWFPWGAQKLSAAQYVSIFRAAVTAFRAVPGNHFQYVWNLNAGNALPGRSEFDTYPGKAYVNQIGIDWYAQNGGSGSPAATIPPILQFARARGLPVSIDEWGVDGVADPAPYIDYVAQVVDDPQNRVAFQAYFSSASSAILKYPVAVATYRQDFSGC